MSTTRKDPIINHDKTIIGLKKYQCLTPDVPPFFPGNKRLLNWEMMIILKLQILHNLKKMIRHILIKMIILQRWNIRKILMTMTNTKRILQNIKTVMKVLIILKSQILCVMKVLSTQPRKKKHWLNGWCLEVSSFYLS